MQLKSTELGGGSTAPAEFGEISRTRQFVFGLGPLEIALVLAIAALLFGSPMAKWFGKQAGEVVGATERSREEFEAGREAE